jgi:preprotein translocase subunit SecE
MHATNAKSRNPLVWLVRYVRESKREMGKVSWPSRQDTLKYALVVIGLSVFIAVYFSGLDWLFSRGFEQLLALTS